MKTKPPKCEYCDGKGWIEDNGEGEASACPDCEGTGDGPSEDFEEQP